jgi:Bacterial PH domain/Short C-terminal domain
MRYTDSLLADGEVVVRRARQHWLALLVDGRRAWILLLVGVLALIVGLLVRDAVDPWRTIGSVLSVIALVGLAAGVLDAAYHLLRWQTQDYVVTNRRVVQVGGILNKRAADSSLEKINDAILEQNVVGRMFGYGDLDILTASESAIDRFRMLARAADFKREMLNQKHALELEVGRAPAPALRADTAGAPDRPLGGGAGAEYPEPAYLHAAPGAPAAGAVVMSPVPVAVPPSGPTQAPAAAPGGDSRQVTATLSRLADLRDRGAITPEEFETKKAELLARL